MLSKRLAVGGTISNATVEVVETAGLKRICSALHCLQEFCH